MGTVNIQCGHCGNVMAVTDDLLGRQVRCPHCEQVVQVPPPAAPPAPPPPEPPPTAFNPPVEAESIFTSHEATDEDLFGLTPVPRVQMPPERTTEPLPPPPPAKAVPPPEAPPQAPPDVPVSEATVPSSPGGEMVAAGAPADGPSEAPSEGGPGGPGTLVAPDTEGTAATGPAFAPEPFAAPATEAAVPDLESPALARARKGGGGWVVPVLIVPLILYSVLATVAIVYLISQAGSQQQRNPLEMLPDQGEHPGASHLRQKIDFHRTPLLPLPASLRVRLGHSLTVGDLKVTPQRAELRKLRYRTADLDKVSESRGESLLVWLELENVSRDVVFRPLDRFFTRYWPKDQVESNMPFTYLEAEGPPVRRFYGGPDLDPRQTIDGQDLDSVLRPGETMTTFVCTDPDDPVAQFLADYRGPLLYRVRLRRGLVPLRGKEVSATAIIGVEFSGGDVVRAEAPAD